LSPSPAVSAVDSWAKACPSAGSDRGRGCPTIRSINPSGGLEAPSPDFDSSVQAYWLRLWCL